MPSRGVAPARGGAHTGSKKAVVAPAAITAEGAAGAEIDIAGSVEPNAEAADSTGQEHSEAVEEEQSPQEVDESVGHEGQTYDEVDHEDAPPPEADDTTAKSDADPAQSQNITAEDHSDTGDDIVSEPPAPPGEGDAEHSVSETEAEAVSEHKPDAASRATELEARLDEVKPRHAVVGDELEGVVKSFPSSVHLDVAGEIPDED